MTHAEFFAGRPTPGFESPACTGELERQWCRSEAVWHLDAFRPHAVELYRCAGCGTFVSYDATACRVLNAYQQPPVTQLARELARALDVAREG